LIVIDTNILVGLLVPGAGALTAARVYAKDPDWIAPPLLRSEFRNVLATLVRRRVIDSDSAFLIMEEAERILDGNEFPVNSAEVLALSESTACSAYDCEYVALARMLRIPLITLDREVLAAFPKTAVDPETFVNSI
jgi:predicted nucleic acid-binding protein